MKKSFIIVLLTILQTQISLGVEIISQHEIAKRYISADLVIIGKVISIKTETIELKKTILKDGRTNIDKTLIDIYTVKIDSVIKGTNTDSMIIIQSNPFPDNEQKEKFEKVNESGDSSFTAIITESLGYRDGADIIHKAGNYIILIKVENNKSVSTLSMEVTESNLDFLKEVKEKGLDAVILKPPDNTNN